MKVFHTKYKSRGHYFASYVIAENDKQARSILSVRNMQESIDGFSSIDGTIHLLPSVHNIVKSNNTFTQEQVLQILHTSMFLLHLGEKSGRFAATELFADTDPFHNIIHLANMKKVEIPHWEDMESFLKTLERSAPEMYLHK